MCRLDQQKKNYFIQSLGLIHLLYDYRKLNQQCFSRPGLEVVFDTLSKPTLTLKQKVNHCSNVEFNSFKFI